MTSHLVAAIIAGLFLFGLGRWLCEAYTEPVRCRRCREPLEDNGWPDGDGVLCQMCWEKECSDAWWYLLSGFEPDERKDER